MNAKLRQSLGDFDTKTGDRLAEVTTNLQADSTFDTRTTERLAEVEAKLRQSLGEFDTKTGDRWPR